MPKPLKRPGAQRADPVARLRAICLALPGANEKISHGEPVWRAGTGKLFAMLDDHHHGPVHGKGQRLDGRRRGSGDVHRRWGGDRSRD